MNLTAEEKEQFAEENVRLIHYFTKKYHKSQWNYDDLFGAASLGMTKALNTFDKDKGIKFATYSARCIINAIFMFMRSEKKHLNTVSIDQPITTDEGGSELTILDTLSNPEIETDWHDISSAVNTVLGKLSERNRHIMHQFFDNANQREIGKKFNLSQSYVSRIIQEILGEIKKEYWRGEKAVRKLEMTVKEFVDLRYKQKLSFVQIAKMKGVSDPAIHNWKDRHADEIKKALKALNLPRIEEKKAVATTTSPEPKQPAPAHAKAPEPKPIQKPTQPDTDEDKNAPCNCLSKEEKAEYERLIAALRSDLTEAHKQLDERDEKIRELEQLEDACGNENWSLLQAKEELERKLSQQQELRQHELQETARIYREQLDDAKKELLAVEKEKEELQPKYETTLNVIERLNEHIKGLKLQIKPLEEENQAMRLLIKKWA